MKTTLKRSCSFYRPYYYNGKKIESIVIYKDGEIILKTRSGWLEDRTENLESKFDADLLEITIDGEIKRANKENLLRKDNYLLKGRRDYNFDNGYILYIHVNNIFNSYEYIQKYGNTKHDNDYFLYGYKVELKHDAIINDHYLKHYKKGDIIEECDRRKSFHAGYKKDDNGKFLRDDNGDLVEDGTFHCLRYKEITRKNFILYNGLYIKEGR